MRVIFAGNKTISTRCLKWLVEKGFEVVQVYGHRDMKADLEFHASLRECAVKLGLPFDTTNANKCIDHITALKADVFISVQYGPLIKQPLLSMLPFNCINLHNGDIPRYGGCKPVWHAIWNGEPRIGMTLHYMDENFDTGRVLFKDYLEIGPDDTSKSIAPAVEQKLFETFCAGLMYTIETRATGVPSSTFGKSSLYYTNKAMNWNEVVWVRWDEPMQQVHNRIRAFTLEHGWTPRALYKGHRILITNSRMWPYYDAHIDKFGRILKVVDGRAYIAVRDGVVAVDTSVPVEVGGLLECV